jgi:superfamily II DNA or RNA helicase
MDDSSFRDLLRFADYLGLEGKAKFFRLNLFKCAALNYEDLDRLARYGLILSEEVKQKIIELKNEKIVNIELLGGDLVITATPSAKPLLSNLVFYEFKTKTFRAQPKDLWILLDRLKNSCLVNVMFDLKLELSFHPKPSFKLRDYQLKCYSAWIKNGFKGVIALPTAAGKTFLGLQAIADLKVATLIIVPTIDLLYQWRKKLELYLNIPKDKIGVYGGGSQKIEEITVITYDSAYLNAEKISGRFMLIITDEAHHAVAEEFKRIFQVSIAKYRMGLTATPFRSDELHKHYNEVLGSIIQPITRQELENKGYIASYNVERYYVKLEPEKLKEYDELLKVYKDYCECMFPEIKDGEKKFRLCLKYAAKDPKAREALRARNKARIIALSAEKKVEAVGELLSRYGDKKVLIFSRYVDVVKAVSKKYLIPLIVSETSNKERKAVLDMFKEGKVTKLASGMTLEEGIDVPDAEIGIIISGSGSNREYLQRVGRLLRPKKEKALVIEIVTKGTIDQALSYRRKKFRIWPKEE